MLKTRFNTNEILTSLMLVYVAQLFLDWLVRGPWRDPQGLQLSADCAVSTRRRMLPEIMPMSGRANWGFVFALVASPCVVWFMLSKTLKGFEVQGAGPAARGQGGLPASRRRGWCFRLPGFGRACRPCRHLGGVRRDRAVAARSISPGYGFTAIIVAFLGRLNPLGIVAAGCVLALSYLGGEAAQMSIGVSDKAVRAFQGMLLFFVLACDTLILYRIRIVGLGAPRPQREPDAWACLKRSC